MIYFSNQQKVGSELRGLLAQVDEVLPNLPPDSHKQVSFKI